MGYILNKDGKMVVSTSTESFKRILGGFLPYKKGFKAIINSTKDKASRAYEMPKLLRFNTISKSNNPLKFLKYNTPYKLSLYKYSYFDSLGSSNSLLVKKKDNNTVGFVDSVEVGDAFLFKFVRDSNQNKENDYILFDDIVKIELESVGFLTLMYRGKEEVISTTLVRDDSSSVSFSNATSYVVYYDTSVLEFNNRFSVRFGSSKSKFNIVVKSSENL